jgi:hypothetical protein
MANGQDTDRGPQGGPYKRKQVGTSTTKKKDDVSTTSMAYEAMLPKWRLIEALLGGTRAMRAASDEYLPKHEYEGKQTYEERRDRATLLNYTRFTLNTLTGKAFREPPQLSEDAAEELKNFVEDVDGSGTGLAVFARRWFKAGLAKAMCHVLVDFSRPEETDEDRPRTKQDDEREGVRPFWMLVAPENLIFAHADLIDGREVYTHVRIRETAVEMDGYAEVVRERIRVIEPGRFELFEMEETKKGQRPKWVKIDDGETGVDFVPLVTFYTDREDTCEGTPPLEDLAHLNVSHFQSTSDQRAILTVSRFAMLAVAGAPATDEETDEPLVVGPKRWLSTPDAQGKFYYVEPQGSGIEQGWKDLSELEEQMSMYGAEFLKKRPGSVTATGRAIDSSEAISPLQAMGVDFKDALELALSYTLAWLGRNDAGADNYAVTFEVDVDVDASDGKELDTLDKARTRRDISRETYLKELKRRGVLDDDFDADDDKDALSDETDDMGLFGGETPPDDDGDETNDDPPVDPKGQGKVKEPEVV